jgi:hypothetical protein
MQVKHEEIKRLSMDRSNLGWAGLVKWPKTPPKNVYNYPLSQVPQL